MEGARDARIRRLHEKLIDWAGEAPSAPVRELLFEMSSRPMAYYRACCETDPLARAEFDAGMRALLDFVDGELSQSPDLGRAVRLGDVADRLEEARQYAVSVEMGLHLDAPGAVRLTTAHGSMGCEYDCAYLLDADDATWHRAAASGGLYPGNLLIGDERDEDDARRLLFVALTRARRHLEICRAAGATMRELVGIVATDKVESDPSALSEAIETEWHNSYRFDSPELVRLIDTRKDVKHLSASALNLFVTYEKDCANSLSFPERQVLQLPSEPSISLKFGTIVTSAYRDRVAWMDFPREDVGRYVQRFERICSSFVPWLVERVAAYRHLTEVDLHALTLGGTPLFGRLDLLLIDDADKSVRIVDYKTGFNYAVSDGYERQLRFYKLLVERSSQFEGFTVVSMDDLYVEPEKDTGVLRSPLSVVPTPEEVRSLECLADAVWERIEAGDWDTSGFERSELFEHAVRAQGEERSKREKARVMQRAYETWLVEDRGCR